MLRPRHQWRRQVAARRWRSLLIGTRRQLAQTAVGRVKSASPDTLVVLGKSQGKAAEWTFALDTNTKIRKAGKDVTVTDLKEGDAVQVRYMEHGGKRVAQTVRARTTPPRPEAKPIDKPAEKKP